MDRPIGLAALTVLELAPPDMVSCAAQAGYDCVGLRLLPATETETRHPIIGDTPMLRETLQRLAGSRLRVLDIELFRLKPDTDVREYRAALETGARFGAREALVAGNDPDERRLADRFGAFCDLAAEFGIGANLEPMPWADLRDFGQGARIIEAAGRGNAGLVIDPIHFDRAGNRPDEIASVPARHLRYMQLCDAPAERPADVETVIHQARAERLMPGDGGLDLRGILRAVPPGIPVSVEVPMRTLARSVPALLRARRMLAKTRQLLDSL